MPDQRGAGFVENVHRQGNEARANDPQSGPFHLFTPGMVKIVVEPPEQRRPGRDFDQAVQAEADKETDPAMNPATMETRPSALL